MKDLLRYLKYLNGVRGICVLGVLFGVLFAASSGAGLPAIIKYVLSDLFVARTADSGSIWNAVFAALLIPVALGVRALAGFGQTYCMNFCSQHVMRGLRQDIFDKFQALPMQFFQQHSSGDLLSRANNDAGVVEGLILDTSTELLRQPLQVLAAIGYLAYLSFQSSDVFIFLVFLLTVPLWILPIRMIGKKLRSRGLQVQEASADVTAFLTENFAATQDIRCFGLEQRQSSRMKTILRAYSHCYLKLLKYDALRQPIMEVISAIVVAVTFLYAFIAGITFAEFTAIGVALFMLFDPIKKLATLANKFHRSAGAAQRVEEVLSLPISIKDPEKPTRVGRLSGHIEFRNVDFAYGDLPVLSNLSITIPAGKTTAIVGASGAGKSTIIKLIPRFYDIQKGSILIDGHNLTDLTLGDLRRNLAIVPQAPVLLNDTVAENIRLGRLDASPEDLRSASREAFADEFIQKLENGYDTRVGERGDRLSGGQKQRVALARAFLRQAPILLLDEATSALDAESEHFIYEALRRFRGTLVVVAHRLSTVQHADQILVMRNGSLVAVGTHAELIARDPYYRELVEKQTLK